MSYVSSISARLWLPVLAVAAGLAAGCASTPPPPTTALETARQSILHAEQANAARDAPLELSEARERLAAADSAVALENMESAERLAKEAQVLAELAIAKANMEGERRANEDIALTTRMLEEELQRARPRGGDR